ncbi:MAG: hypothetical protein KF791_14790 [Verrucomicrobiae bacterium]|nr:hypothetical protein [Verrucomicrobiae bacterium]
MNLSRLLPGFLRSTRRLPVVTPAEPPALFETPTASGSAAGGPTPHGGDSRALPASTRSRRPRRSWFGWLFGRNRRRDRGGLVQGELLLTQVRPVRNDFRDADALEARSRSRGKVLYETPPLPVARDDQDHAWNRLRNRPRSSLVISVD